MPTLLKSSHADKMTQLGLVSCSFLYTAENGIDFTICSKDEETGSLTAATPLFDYTNDDHVQAVRDICVAIIDDGFPHIHNITEVGGSFYQMDGEIIFEGTVTTTLTGMTATIS